MSRYDVWAQKAYQEAYEAEHHIHGRTIWFGVDPTPDAGVSEGDIDSMSPFQIDAGNDGFPGSDVWTLILGTGDTPVETGMQFYDPDIMVIDEVETDQTITRLQLAWGASGAIGEAAGDMTEILFKPAKAATQIDPPFTVQAKRIPSGTKLWARCWVAGANTSTIDFFLGIHEYLK